MSDYSQIQSMIDDVANRDLVSAEVKFQNVMNDKVANALSQEKERVAKTLFRDKEESEG